ncbi:hypothetical protein ACROYT_G014744 [Oculina patagonica]
MKQTDFRDWSSYLGKRFVPISKDTDGNRVKMMDMHWLNLMVHHPDKVLYGFSTDEPWKKVKILFNPRLKPGSPNFFYGSPLKVNTAKLNDLQDMASKFISEPQHLFYFKMTAAPKKKKKSQDGNVCSEEKTVLLGTTCLEVKTWCPTPSQTVLPHMTCVQANLQEFHSLLHYSLVGFWVKMREKRICLQAFPTRRHKRGHATLNNFLAQTSKLPRVTFSLQMNVKSVVCNCRALFSHNFP